MIKYTFEQHSEAWNQIRCGKITGTRFATLVSGDSTKGYKDLITEIAAEILTGEKEETYQNAIMERGTDLEPYARKEYENIFGVKVDQFGFISPDEDNEFYEWIGISPDGLIDNNLLEIKCPLIKTHLNYIKDNKFPSVYKYQVQAQLYITGAEYCDFMSYYPNLKPFIIRVLPDNETFERFEMELKKIIPLIKNEIEIYNNYKLF